MSVYSTIATVATMSHIMLYRTHFAALLFVATSWSAPALAADATLSWDITDAGDAIDGWKLYYDRDQPGPPYEGVGADQGPSPIDVPVSAVANPSSPSFQVTGLESCRDYWFAVAAYNAAGESDLSAEILQRVVVKPRDVFASSPGVGQARINWTGLPLSDPGTVAGYQVYYDIDSGAPYETAVALPVTDEYNFDGLQQHTAYYFVVEAFCENGATRRSDEASVVVQGVGENPNPDPMNPDEPSPANNESPEDPDEYIPPEAAGCGCASASGTHDASWLLLFGVALLRRRRDH